MKKINMISYVKKIIVLLLFFVCNSIYSQAKDVIEILVQKNENARDIAQKYFDEPDLWQVVLKENNLDSPSKIVKGLKLKLPSGKIKQTAQKMRESLDNISSATNQGAKLFAKDLISKSLDNYNKGVNSRQEGEWSRSIQFFESSIKASKEAEVLAKKNREAVSEAIVSFKKGNVESRTPKDRLWKDAEINSKLIEEDMARTLSDSYAEISFADKSKIRLNENSQAVIKKSRVDLLKNKKETQVTLVKGDAFALLMKNPKKKFDLETAGISTKVNSKFFWVSKNEESTKIANYDGEIEIQAKDSMVVVKQNQGSIVPKGGVPSQPIDLLPQPKLSAPDNNQVLFAGAIKFEWGTVEDALGYWFILAEDKDFTKLVRQERNNKTNAISLTGLSAGTYYWKVSGIDKFGLPGQGSEVNLFVMKYDEYQPYLSITEPRSSAVTKDETILVSGITEVNVILTINEEKIEVSDSGKFSASVKLSDGVSSILIKVTDQAGNETQIIRDVVYESSPDFEIQYSDECLQIEKNHFITSSKLYSLMGRTRAYSTVLLNSISNSTVYRAYADSSGYFTFNMLEILEKESFNIKAVSPAKYEFGENIVIEYDGTPPVIVLDAEIPKVSSSQSVLIRGKVSGAENANINSEEIKLTENKFSKEIKLHAGSNHIIITAEDVAGNISKLEREVIFDNSPPALIDYKISKKKISAGSEICIEINFQDDSQVKKVAKVVYSADSKKNTIFAQLQTGKMVYSGCGFVPIANPEIKINSITLEDYNNNSKEYLFK
ncbi:MAG: FecR domain-containing protein [Bacteroidota bacterium]